MGGGNAPSYEEITGGKDHDNLSGGNGDDLVQDNQSPDSDWLCDGNGTDIIDMQDEDVSDRWYQEADGVGEILVLRDQDDLQMDIIITQSCLFTPF